MSTLVFARLFTRRTLGTFLLVTLLALAGCGGESTTPAPAIPPTATLIPTLPPPATPVPVQPTATAEPTATAQPTATVAVEATEEVTTTEEVATTEEVTATEEMTATEETTATETVTGTEEVTVTAEITVAEEVTATEELTATERVTATQEATETEEATSTATVTATGEVTATEELIASEEATETHGIGAGHAMTETKGISPSAEITGSTGVTEATGDARVFFLQPTTNAIVPLTFTVVMSYTGVTVAPADEDTADNAVAEESEGAGHLHILVDTDFVETGETIPESETHLHFGDGSTTAELSLTPGSHILRLQYADNEHVALEGDQYRHEIIVNAVEGAPEQAVRIVSPTSGAVVPPTFTVTMAATGLSVEPAGPVGEGAGHFHLLIDEPYVAAGQVIPTDETHLHFGKAQLTTTVTLEPGAYLLRLQMADGAHRALSGDQYRDEVQIVVDEDAPAEQVIFVKPADGATVTSPFLVAWAANGLIIESAGNVIRPGGGHLHVLVDEEFIAAGEVIPTDETHLHFGKGQTNAELTLEPGEHTLRLQMANGAHLAQDGPQYQDEITVTVR